MPHCTGWDLLKGSKANNTQAKMVVQPGREGAWDWNYTMWDQAPMIDKPAYSSKLAKISNISSKGKKLSIAFAFFISMLQHFKADTFYQFLLILSESCNGVWYVKLTLIF